MFLGVTCDTNVLHAESILCMQRRSIGILENPEDCCIHVCKAMPRPTKNKSPLREIRRGTGLTQEQFGRLVGASRMLVQKIENGERALTDDLAIRIAQETGCNLQGYSDGGRKRVRVWEKVVDPEVARRGKCPVGLRDYSRADFDAHREKMKKEDPARRKRWLDGLLEAARLLLAAAERAGKFDAVAGDLQQLIGRSVVGYQLQSHLEGWLRESGISAGAEKALAENFIRLPANTALEIKGTRKRGALATGKRREAGGK